MKPLVSIIITYYMYQDYVRDCIKSCFAQTHKPIEIILVDDCSPDVGHGSPVTLILPTPWTDYRYIRHETNQGYAKAKNTGIREATGEYITFIDADDCLTPDSIVKRVEAFKPGIDFVHGNVYNVSNPNWSYEDMLANTKKLYKDPGTQRYFKKQHRKKIHAQGMMFRKSVFERFGLYWDINSKADKEMNYRLGIHPESPLPKLIKHKKIDDFVSYYRRHKESMKSSLKEKEKQRLKELFNKRIKQLEKEGITKK
ncbi:MAG: glycosyltransferase family 2 protein [PVC group bacterium]|nr:glycosyltransferase family 2 protein [PVC group bacterium]